MKRLTRPIVQAVCLLSLAIILAFAGTASAKIHVSGTCDYQSEMGATGKSTAHEITRDLGSNAVTVINPAQLHHADFDCAAHVCPALSTSNIFIPLVQSAMISPQFVDPDDLILIDLSYGLHRPPNA